MNIPMRPTVPATVMQQLERVWQETRGKELQRIIARELALNMWRAVQMWIHTYQWEQQNVPRERQKDFIRRHVEAQVKQWREDNMLHHYEFTNASLYAFTYELVDKPFGQMHIKMDPTFRMEQLLLGEADIEIQSPESPRYTSGHGIWDRRVYRTRRILSSSQS